MNRHLRTVLRAKGYEVAYESAAGHDFANWGVSAIEGLRVLLGGLASPHESLTRKLR